MEYSTDANISVGRVASLAEFESATLNGRNGGVIDQEREEAYVPMIW